LATPYITQTTAVKALPEIWADSPVFAPSNTLGASNSITDTGDQYFGPGYKIHFPIIGTIAATSLGAAMAGGVSVTVANTETESLVVPTVNYAAVWILEDVLLTMAWDAINTYSRPLKMALDQQVDIDILGLFAGFTTNTITDGADFTEAAFRSLVSSIIANGGDAVGTARGPGTLDAWYHPLKWDTIMGIGNIISASVRGENNSAAKTGTVGTTFGVNFNFSKNVATSTTLRNLILSKQSIVLGRKNRPHIDVERTDLVTKVTASDMHGVKILLETTGGVHIITTTT
jgi:hypothetical protein